MRTSGSLERRETTRGASRRSLRDRVGRRRNLVLVAVAAAIGWGCIVGAVASLEHLFAEEGERGTWTDVALAAVGNFLVAFVIAVVVLTLVRRSGRLRRDEEAEHPPTPQEVGRSTRPARHRNRSVTSHVIRGGAVGAIPGVLIALVPVLLHELDVISSDQSQIGFVGVPIAVIGTLVGTLVAAPDGSAEQVLIGTGSGFAVGLAVGGLLVAFSVAVAGIGLLPIPVCMIAGAAIAVGGRR